MYRRCLDLSLWQSLACGCYINPKNLAQRYVDLSLAAIIDAGGKRCNVSDRSNNNEFAWSSERSIAYC